MSDTDRLIAVTLIDSINGQGYLEDTLEEICAGFDPELDIELDEVEAVLHRIQQFEPAGIAARSWANACCCNCASCPPTPRG